MSQYLNEKLSDKMMDLTSQYLISIIDKGLYKINNLSRDDIEKTLFYKLYPHSLVEESNEFQNVLKNYTFNNEEINELINEFYYNAVVDIHGEYEGTLEEFAVECLHINKLIEVCISLIFGLNKHYYFDLVVSLNSHNLNSRSYTCLK
jgi:hypothetical protein